MERLFFSPLEWIGSLRHLLFVVTAQAAISILLFACSLIVIAKYRRFPLSVLVFYSIVVFTSVVHRDIGWKPHTAWIPLLLLILSIVSVCEVAFRRLPPIHYFTAATTFQVSATTWLALVWVFAVAAV